MKLINDNFKGHSTTSGWSLDAFFQEDQEKSAKNGRSAERNDKNDRDKKQKEFVA